MRSAHRYRLLWPLVVVVLLTCISRAPALGAASLWFDEAWSAHAAMQPGLIAAANADATNPPLYYALLNAHAVLLGTSEFSLRLFSLFMGLLLVPLVFALARRLLDDNSAFWAACAAALMPLLWWASREARMYTLLAVLTLAAALALHHLMRQPARWAWIALWLTELGLLYAHNTGPIAVVWLNLCVVLAWVGGRSLRRPDWRVWLAGQAVVVLLWLPYFALRFAALPAANASIGSSVTLSLESLAGLWRAFWQTPWERILFAGESAVPLIALLALFLVALPYGRAGARWALLHATLWTAGVVAGLLVLGNELHGRYLVVAAPFLAVAVGAAVARPQARGLRLVGASILLIVFAANILWNAAPTVQRDDVRGTVQAYADRLGSEDSVIAWSYADRYDLAYYWDRLGVQAARITLPEGAGLDAVLPLLPASGDVALNTWFTQRADYRGMLGCLLAASSATPPDGLTTAGMTSRFYHDIHVTPPDWQTLDLRASDSGRLIAEGVSSGALPDVTADRAACVPIRLRLAAETDEPLRAAVIARDPFGRELARADAVFATDDQRTSDAAAAGEVLEAYAPLRLPAGTPAGDYAVTLRLYDAAHPSGYALASDALEVIGPDAALGRWRVLPGARWTDVDAQAAADTLPVQAGSSFGDGLTLLAHDAVSHTLRNGDTLYLTLLWQGDGTLPLARLAAADGSWSVDLPALAERVDGLTLDWRRAVVPADAATGEAILTVNDAELARYLVEALPVITTLPAESTPIGAEYPGIGVLAAADWPATISLQAPPAVTLYWQAGDTMQAGDWTVFVQLLNADGQVIAQSDSRPAGGARPTTGWRSGEIITDAHTLMFNGLAAEGTGRLIAGLYDAQTGQRARLPDGADFVLLADGVPIGP